MFYGRSGTGKTTLASTFPGKKLLLDVKDQGDDSVADIANLDVLDIRDWDNFELYYWYLVKHPTKYQVLIVDTVSQLQQLAILKVMEKRGISADKVVKGRKVSGGAGDFGSMTKQAWGDVAALMKTWIINLRDLPMTVIFIAQDRVFNMSDENDDEQGAIAPEVGPALSPSIAKHLNAAVHFIGNTFIRQRTVTKRIKKGRQLLTKNFDRTEFCLRIGPNAVYITKVRKPRSIEPPSVVVNPRYEDIINLVEGKKS